MAATIAPAVLFKDRLETVSASSPAPFASLALGPSFAMDSFSPRDRAAIRRYQADVDLFDENIKSLEAKGEYLDSVIRKDSENLEKKRRRNRDDEDTDRLLIEIKQKWKEENDQELDESKNVLKELQRKARVAEAAAGASCASSGPSEPDRLTPGPQQDPTDRRHARSRSPADQHQNNAAKGREEEPSESHGRVSWYEDNEGLRKLLAQFLVPRPGEEPPAEHSGRSSFVS